MANTFIGYWNFNKNDASIVHDYSCHELPSTLTTNLTIAASNIGYCGVYDGTTTVNHGNLSALSGLAAISIMFKVNLRANAAHTVFSKASNHSVEIDAGRKIIFTINGALGASSVTSTTVLTLGAWYTVICLYDGTTMKIYIDGIQDASTTTVTDTLNTNTNALFSGGTVAAASLDGKLECYAYWNRAINSDEITFVSTNPTGTPRQTLGDTIATGDLLASDFVDSAINGTEVCTYFDSVNGLYYSIPIDIAFSGVTVVSSVGNIWNTGRQQATLMQHNRVLIQKDVNTFSDLFASANTIWGVDATTPGSPVVVMPLSAGAIWAGNGSNKAAEVAAVAVGSILVAGGVGVAPAYSSSPTISTSVTTPLLIGGTAVGSYLAYKSTTGVGTVSGIAHQFIGGNNGATVVATMLNNGDIGIATTAPTAKLHIIGAGNTSATFAFKADNSSSVPLLHLYNSGQIRAGGGSSDRNLFMGVDSGLNVVTVAFGTGFLNTTLGYRAGANITEGTRNVFLGGHAGEGAGGGLTGSYNIAIGGATLAGATSANDNICIGESSGNAITTGSAHLAIGRQALLNNATGVGSVALGRNALLSSTGDYNVGIGYSAAENKVAGDNNVFIGRLAGFTKTSGSGNIYLGYRSGYNQTTTSDQLFIDNQDRGSAANDLTKALIYGEFNATVTSQILRFNASVGIGTVPSANLHSLSTTEQLRVGYDDSNYYSTTVGSTGITTKQSIGTASATVFIGGNQVGSYAELRSTGAVGTTDYLKFTVGNNGATETMRVIDIGANGGAVCIGTTVQTNSRDYLTVQRNHNQNAAISMRNTTNGTNAFASITAVSSTANIVIAAFAAIYGTSGMHVANTSALYVTAGSGLNIGTFNSAQLSFWSNNTERARFLSTGEFGIGVTAPTANIHVVQTAAATGTLKSVIVTGAINTNQTLSTEISNITFTNTGRQWATGALTTQREVLITAPTYSFVGASTITTAATLAISGAPIAGTNATLTNTYALWVQGGKSLFAGNVELTQTVTTEVVISDTTVTMVINGTTYKLLAKA